MRQAIWIAAAVGTCITLAGCGGGPAGSPGNSPRAAGNFCADYKNIGKKIPVPSDQGSLSTLRQRSVRYLRSAAAYYDGLASEASSQAGTELHVISSANLTLANLISSGKVRARSQIKLKMLTLTTKGSAAAATGRLVVYVATRCG